MCVLLIGGAWYVARARRSKHKYVIKHTRVVPFSPSDDAEEKPAEVKAQTMVANTVAVATSDAPDTDAAAANDAVAASVSPASVANQSTDRAPNVDAPSLQAAAVGERRKTLAVAGKALLACSAIGRSGVGRPSRPAPRLPSAAVTPAERQPARSVLRDLLSEEAEVPSARNAEVPSAVPDQLSPNAPKPNGSVTPAVPDQPPPNPLKPNGAVAVPPGPESGTDAAKVAALPTPSRAPSSLQQMHAELLRDDARMAAMLKRAAPPPPRRAAPKLSSVAAVGAALKFRRTFLVDTRLEETELEEGWEGGGGVRVTTPHLT